MWKVDKMIPLPVWSATCLGWRRKKFYKIHTFKKYTLKKNTLKNSFGQEHACSEFGVWGESAISMGRGSVGFLGHFLDWSLIFAHCCDLSAWSTGGICLGRGSWLCRPRQQLPPTSTLLPNSPTSVDGHPLPIPPPIPWHPLAILWVLLGNYLGNYFAPLSNSLAFPWTIPWHPLAIRGGSSRCPLNPLAPLVNSLPSLGTP